MVDAAVGKLVVAADMVEMRVARDADERPSGHQGHVTTQAEVAEAAVEQQIAVAAAHVPHVAAEERLDPRLVDQRDVVRHADRLVPVAGADNVELGHGSLVQRDDLVRAAMQLDALADRKRRADREVDGEAQPRLGLGGDTGALEATLEDEIADGAGAEADVAVGRSADADALRTDGDESVGSCQPQAKGPAWRGRDARREESCSRP